MRAVRGEARTRLRAVRALARLHRKRERRHLGTYAVALGFAGFTVHAGAADNPAEIFELPSVQVVGTAPLPGFGTPLRDVPANVQLFDNRSLSRARPLSLTQFLDLNSNSVNAASGQGNAFQQSLDFREFETLHGPGSAGERAVLAESARFFGCDAGELAFTDGARTGLALVAAGLELQPGDEVLVTPHDHPAAVYPWVAQARRRGIRVVRPRRSWSK